ncbi:hypothetical protein E4K66_01255 [Bradyrhizobium frederickii]|uniref:Uncharacterized protein n=1 Tax=Bradyrhizobium frederickii TaxID=2560054 RepID=A0A4Y9LGX9_9BRAD|nr:hypothetical protein E4K66_01255 [Bradyrhizobium frederickii]
MLPAHRGHANRKQPVDSTPEDSFPARKLEFGLKRDAIRMNHHRALGCCLSMIFSENRCALFRIML